MQHILPRVAKAVLAMMIFASLAAGCWFGPQAIAAHAAGHHTSVSYADQDTIARTLRQANHTPAAAGDFRADASIQTGDVVSAVKAVG